MKRIVVIFRRAHYISTVAAAVAGRSHVQWNYGEQAEHMKEYYIHLCDLNGCRLFVWREHIK